MSLNKGNYFSKNHVIFFIIFTLLMLKYLNTRFEDVQHSIIALIGCFIFPAIVVGILIILKK